MSPEGPLKNFSDDQLVDQGGTAASIEMMRRLKEAIREQDRSAMALGNRIWWLNFWLLIFTMAIFLLTAVLAGKELVR